MKTSGGGADDSLGPPLGQRPVWDTNGPDLECDCPGPPPRFHLPPPPRPPSLSAPQCSTASSDACKPLTVIDSGYRHGPAIPSGTIILVTAVAVAVFVFIGTFLVLLKKRRMPGVFGGKASLRSRCDRTSANGVIYEDLPNIRPRTLSPPCPLPQTRLPSIEMIDVAYTDRLPFTPALIAPKPPPLAPCDAQDMFNPVYEELSNASPDHPDSNSEDDFAEDELSLGGEGDQRPRPRPPRSGAFLRDADSDPDDSSRFLGNAPRRTCRGPARRANTLDRRKMRPDRTPPPLLAPPADCTELNQGFLLRRILQMYPDVTGVSLEYPRGGAPAPEGGDYESLPRPKPDIFSTLEKRCVRRQGEESGPGSDSGYSNKTSGGRGGGAGRESGGAMLS